MKIADTVDDGAMTDIAKGATIETVIALANGNGVTGVLVTGAADQLVQQDGDLVPWETPLPGVSKYAITDACSTTSWFNRGDPLQIADLGTYGNASGGVSGNTPRAGLSEIAYVPLAVGLETGPGGTGPRTAATVDAGTGMVTVSNGGMQVDTVCAVATTPSPYADRIALLRNWLEGTAAEGPAMGTSASTMAAQREGILNWIQWLLLNWEKAGLTNEEVWALLDLLHRALDAWKYSQARESDHRPTGAQPDKRTMRPEEWEEIEGIEEALRKAAEAASQAASEGEEEQSFGGWLVDRVVSRNPIVSAYRNTRDNLQRVQAIYNGDFEKAIAGTDVEKVILYSRKKDRSGEEIGVVGGWLCMIGDNLGVADMCDAADSVDRFTHRELTPLERLDRGLNGAEKYGNAVAVVVGGANLARGGGGRCFVAGTLVLVLRDGVNPEEVEAAEEQGLDLTPYCESKPIEDIKPGDMVLSRPDGQPHAPLCFSRVEQTFVNVVEELVDVAVAEYATRTGGSIRATVGHPFWVSAVEGTPAPLADPNSPHMARSMTYCRDANGATLTGSSGWVFASDLRPGYALSSTTGTPDVTAVREFRCERTVVYNFRVAETHSYFVATPDGCALWVHNTNSEQLARAVTKADPKLSELSRAAAAADRNGLTKAGRALQKHGDRRNSAYPQVKGGPAKLNSAGQDIVDDILTTPGSVNKPNKYGGIDVVAPDGRGVRYDASGQMMGFLEP